VEPERTKIIKRLTGPTFKTGPGSDMITLSRKLTKSAESFDDHVFEGEGDIFLGENKHVLTEASPFHPKPQRSNPNA
jgi:hypothetical protein